jgi:hypothetical protein
VEQALAELPLLRQQHKAALRDLNHSIVMRQLQRSAGCKRQHIESTANPPAAAPDCQAHEAAHTHKGD